MRGSLAQRPLFPLRAPPGNGARDRTRFGAVSVGRTGPPSLERKAIPYGRAGPLAAGPGPQRIPDVLPAEPPSTLGKAQGTSPTGRKIMSGTLVVRQSLLRSTSCGAVSCASRASSRSVVCRSSVVRAFFSLYIMARAH